jgi:hypothetical protein
VQKITYHRLRRTKWGGNIRYRKRKILAEKRMYEEVFLVEE